MSTSKYENELKGKLIVIEEARKEISISKAYADIDNFMVNKKLNTELLTKLLLFRKIKKASNLLSNTSIIEAFLI